MGGREREERERNRERERRDCTSFSSHSHIPHSPGPSTPHMACSLQNGHSFR